MELYLVQHGLAKSKEEDPDRSLNTIGRDETKAIASRLHKAGINPDKIWHSGKLRAEETASILAEILGLNDKAVLHENLSPGDPVDPVFRDLKELTGSLMIVGHLPYLSKFLSALLNLKEGECPVKFRNSAVVCLNNTDVWKIRWILHPDLT